MSVKTKHREQDFKIQEFLNPSPHPSSSSVTAYCGRSPWKSHSAELIYLRISDCKQTIELHPTDYDSSVEFIKKLKKLERTIKKFRKYLEERYE